MKTIKIMSDGNQAKVGMICTYKEEDNIEIGKITRIKTGIDYICETDVLFQPINAVYVWPTKDHFASLNILSKATPEQKKLYWKEIEKQNIQFRPEFEAKLKKLGIRDQFVNNLFDPKCQTVSVNRQKGLLAETWKQLIDGSFNWCLSSEGYFFWENIYFE